MPPSRNDWLSAGFRRSPFQGLTPPPLFDRKNYWDLLPSLLLDSFLSCFFALSSFLHHPLLSHPFSSLSHPLSLTHSLLSLPRPLCMMGPCLSKAQWHRESLYPPVKAPSSAEQTHRAALSPLHQRCTELHFKWGFRGARGCHISQPLLKRGRLVIYGMRGKEGGSWREGRWQRAGVWSSSR